MLKRYLDIVISAAGLLLLFPVLIIVAIFIKIDSKGPVFFIQQRVGKQFKPFNLYKFRSMFMDASKSGPQITSGNDSRITRFGKILRKSKLDELPQLWNVLIGNMSLVGPRPEVFKYVEMFKDEYRSILSIRPGITDYASIEYSDEETILQRYNSAEEGYIHEVLPKKIALNKKYIEEMGLGSDIKIVFLTILKIMRQLLSPSHLKRFLFFLIADALIIATVLYLSFLLRFEFVLDSVNREIYLKAVPLFIAIKLTVFGLRNIYRIIWRYVGLDDLWNIAVSNLLSEMLLMFFILMPVAPLLNHLTFFRIHEFPRSIFIIDFAISLIVFLGLRISKRLYFETIHKNTHKGKKTLIIGAGHKGEMIVRDMSRSNFAEFYPIGFLDDDTNKKGAYIHNVRVLGRTEEAKNIINRYQIEAVIIALPSLNHKMLRKMYDIAKECNVSTVKIIPRIYSFQTASINLKNLEDIQIEDLIGRKPVKIEYDEIDKFIAGNVVLVTGAGGSIGSELTIQICGFHPKKLILFDNDETSLHNMEQRLKKELYDLNNVCFITGDIRDAARVNEVFKAFSPGIVFHAAAYKHVPVMEHNPAEAVKVNIFGTYNINKASVENNVNKFVMISTDKAVRPSSVMGATKRIAEYICSSFNSANATEFISVRFGNVFGSRGSVLPLFLDQLKRGGPLTVTHRDMVRFFMTIPEAVSLVLQASAIGKGGEILVLDMGNPVRIVELAEELIRIHGYEPYKDIDIEFVGMRPGEKLYEELLTEEEGTEATRHDKVFIAKRNGKFTLNKVEKMLRELGNNLDNSLIGGEEHKIKKLLNEYISSFDNPITAENSLQQLLNAGNKPIL